MQIAQQTFLSDGERSQTQGKKVSLLDDEEFFDAFVEESLRRGVFLDQEDDYVKLLSEIQDGLPLKNGKPDAVATVDRVIKHREARAAERPIRAVVSESVEAKGSVASRISERLNLEDGAATDSKISTVLKAIEEAGIDDPETYLSIKEASFKSGVAERTLRRYIADGMLTTEKVKGSRGLEHRLYAPALFMILRERAGAFEKARSSPVEDMGREIAALCRMIVEQQSRADQRTDRLLAEMHTQSRTIDELRAEQRDARAQVSWLQEHMIRALMPPTKKKMSFWQRMLYGDD